MFSKTKTVFLNYGSKRIITKWLHTDGGNVIQSRFDFQSKQAKVILADIFCFDPINPQHIHNLVSCQVLIYGVYIFSLSILPSNFAGPGKHAQMLHL